MARSQAEQTGMHKSWQEMPSLRSVFRGRQKTLTHNVAMTQTLTIMYGVICAVKKSL